MKRDPNEAAFWLLLIMAVCAIYAIYVTWGQV